MTSPSIRLLSEHLSSSATGRTVYKSLQYLKLKVTIIRSTTKIEAQWLMFSTMPPTGTETQYHLGYEGTDLGGVGVGTDINSISHTKLGCMHKWNAVKCCRGRRH